MNLQSILRAIRAHPLLTVSVPVLAIAAALAISLWLPNRYTAVATVLIDFRPTDPVSGAFTGVVPPGYMATQVDIARSERVAKSVIRKLKLDSQPQLLENWRKETGGQGEFSAWLAGVLKNNLYVKPSRESNVIEISYTATTPEFAAAMTNAFMQAYIDTSVDLKVEPARQYSGLFDEQSKKLRERLEEAQARLSTFQRENGIIATDERLDIENARLAELSSQLVGMQALTNQSDSRRAQAASNANNLDEVLNNPVIAGLKTELSRQEARLKELSARLGGAHPTVTEIKANIESLHERIASETRVVTGSVNLNSNVNKSREAQLRAALDQQRNKVLKLKAQRDEVNALQADVVNAQRAYDAVVARFNQMELESRSNQTNVSPLQIASPPRSPSSPRVALNVVSAAVIGVLLGVLGAVLYERLDHRLRGSADLSEALLPYFVGHVHDVDMTKVPESAPLLIGATKRSHLALSSS